MTLAVNNWVTFLVAVGGRLATMEDRMAVVVRTVVVGDGKT